MYFIDFPPRGKWKTLDLSCQTLCKNCSLKSLKSREEGTSIASRFGGKHQGLSWSIEVEAERIFRTQDYWAETLCNHAQQPWLRTSSTWNNWSVISPRRSGCLPRQLDGSLLRWDLEDCWECSEFYLLAGDARDLLDPISVKPQKRWRLQFNFSGKTTRNLWYDKKTSLGI